MESNYPYIIAGLPFLVLDFEPKEKAADTVASFDSLCNPLAELCSVRDRNYIRLLRMGLESHRLNTRFYKQAAASDNGFIVRYFSFDKELRNILAAYTARAFNMDNSRLFVGENELTTILKNSRSEDFDLKNISEIAPRVHKIMQNKDPLEREQQIDKLRWDKTGEFTATHYLDIDVILAFIVKAFIVSRWMHLNRIAGARLFKELIAEVKGSYIKA